MLLGKEHFYVKFDRAVDWVLDAGSWFLDVGTTHRFRKELAPFKNRFREKEYFALDYGAQSQYGELNVDIDGDIHRLPVKSESLDGLFCIEVLEHVRRPYDAVEELARVIRPGGRLLITVPFMAGYHGKAGDYPDYFRYTHEGLQELLSPFESVEVMALGGTWYRLIHVIFPSSLNRRIFSSSILVRIFNLLDSRSETQSPFRWLVLAQR